MSRRRRRYGHKMVADLESSLTASSWVLLRRRNNSRTLRGSSRKKIKTHKCIENEKNHVCVIQFLTVRFCCRRWESRDRHACRSFLTKNEKRRFWAIVFSQVCSDYCQHFSFLFPSFKRAANERMMMIIVYYAGSGKL